MRFEFATANRIIFGPGTIKEAGKLARDLGTKALVVTGRDPHRAAKLLTLLKDAGVQSTTFSVHGEPDLDTVRRGIEQARRDERNLIIGFGGGSALDAGKAIAILLNNPGDILDYLEIIGGGKQLANPSLPFIAIPTTAGTGSEVTRNAVFSSPKDKVKVSLRSPFMLPKIALVDSELTWGMPPHVTAATGMDALTQLIEPYVSNKANPISDAFCVQGIPLVARSLLSAFHDGKNAAARDDMALASLLGGLALSNSGLGAVHGLAGVIGGMFPAPHGAICGMLLPKVIKANADKASAITLERYHTVAQFVSNCGKKDTEELIKTLEERSAEMQLPTLKCFNVTKHYHSEIALKAQQANSMKANPAYLSINQLSTLLETA